MDNINIILYIYFFKNFLFHHGKILNIYTSVCLNIERKREDTTTNHKIKTKKFFLPKIVFCVYVSHDIMKVDLHKFARVLLKGTVERKNCNFIECLDLIKDVFPCLG